MRRASRIASCLAATLSVLTGQVAAQQVAEIQVNPPELTLTVGESDFVIAAMFDGQRNPVTSAEPTWVSSNVNVATVQPDPGQPTAIVTAIAPGIAQIEARVGNVVAILVVQVQIEQPEAQQAQPAPAAPDSILAADVSTTVRSLVARIEPHNFGFAQPCRVGGFIGNNLLVTSYIAIRGADSITVTLPSGQRVNGGVRVAAYDAQADLAVLHVPVQRTGEIVVGQNPAQSDFVWIVGQPNCQGAQATRARVQSAAAPGLLTLDRETGLGQLGAPIVNQAGEIVGLASGGTGAVRASNISTLATQARRNLAAQSLLTPSQVARAEQHAYGSVALRSGLVGSVARITPLEEWHWPELAQRSTLPINFGGPMGRYQVELLTSGAVQSTTTVTIQAGIAGDVSLTPAVVAGQPQPPAEQPAQVGQQPGGGGGFPIAVVILGLAAAGGGAFLLAGSSGGDNGDGGTITPPTSTTGGIRIIVTIP